MLIGVDLGGTKTEIICLHPDRGEELYRYRTASPRGDYDATVKSIYGLVNKAKEETGLTPESIGIGIPGTISTKTGCVKNANSTWINGHPLGRDLSELIGVGVEVDNDANCFAISEAVDGAAKGCEVVFGVIIGTGCGAGLVVDGKAHIGMNGLGGEWGHNQLPMPRIYSPDAAKAQAAQEQARDAIMSPIYAHKTAPSLYVADEVDNEYPGHACYCGKFGCLETWISGTGFENDYFRRSGSRLKGPEIIALVEKGDAQASATLQAYADRLARGLAGVVNIIDPDAIVLGGGMGNIKQLYDLLPDLVENYSFTDHLDVHILSPVHGDSSGVRGAAWLGKSA